MTARAETALVHLVRRANDFAAFETFMGSYERYPAGIDHELVLLLKGFDSSEDAVPYLERAAGARPGVVHVDDGGLDLTAYLEVSRRLRHRILCFTNSFSEVLVPGWLELLRVALDAPGVGAAGATGSYASPLAYAMHQLGMTGGYGDVYDDVRGPREQMFELTGARYRGDVVNWLSTLHFVLRGIPGMSLFPSVHLRTNGFMIERDLLCSLKVGRLRNKRATYRLESGRDSLTTQLAARGRPGVVVDRLGTARVAPDWHAADVLWQGRQDDLLIADNQTRQYAVGPPARRAMLSGLAWGLQARPWLGD